VIISLIAYRIKQRHEAHLRRSRRLKLPARNYEAEAQNIYGVPAPVPQGGTVMYQINMPQSNRRIGGRRS
jgi:hypothetical protein